LENIHTFEMYTEIFKVKELTQVISIVASYPVTFTELSFIQQTIVDFKGLNKWIFLYIYLLI